jgi:hypothetical protein
LAVQVYSGENKLAFVFLQEAHPLLQSSNSFDELLPLSFFPVSLPAWRGAVVRVAKFIALFFQQVCLILF